jgi:glycosyltransferase involved in cell wall biosynthesis
VLTKCAEKKILEYGLANKEQIVLIPIGIDLSRFDNFKAKRDEARNKLRLVCEKKVIGIVCRLSQEKGVDLFIETADHISRKRNDCCFIIIGDGPLRMRYKLLAKTNAPLAKILFLGWSDKIANILPAFDIYLFTSRWEMFSLVLIEAMACGIPIAGFDITSANEIARNGETAILVKPFDTKLLADTVSNLVEDADLQGKLSRNGIVRAGNFKIENSVNGVASIYDSIIR